MKSNSILEGEKIVIDLDMPEGEMYCSQLSFTLEEKSVYYILI